MITELFQRIQFWKESDRIGPDMPLTHWKLYFPRKMLKLCKKRFKLFSDTASVRPGVYIVACSKIEIGENVVLRPGTMLHADPRDGGAGIVIKDDVLIGSSVHIYVDKHRFDNTQMPISMQGFYDSENVVIESGAWLGANVTVLPGVTIGRNSVIGAGSVVTNSIPDYSVAVGVPAKVIKKIE
ncbi:hypothetical protein NBRC116492_28200 [Aurantivibrio infirmus]